MHKKLFGGLKLFIAADPGLKLFIQPMAETKKKTTLSKMIIS